jgi:hypothetical protein
LADQEWIKKADTVSYVVQVHSCKSKELLGCSRMCKESLLRKYMGVRVVYCQVVLERVNKDDTVSFIAQVHGCKSRVLLGCSRTCKQG